MWLVWFSFLGDGLVLCDNMRRLCKEKKVSHASFCPLM